MGIIGGGMFKVPKHKRYEYKPRYYDAEKKEMEQRIKFVESEARREREAEEAGESAEKHNFAFRSEFENRRAKRESGKRLMVILVLLLAIVYIILWDPVAPAETAPNSQEAPAVLHDILD